MKAQQYCFRGFTLGNVETTTLADLDAHIRRKDMNAKLPAFLQWSIEIMHDPKEPFAVRFNDIQYTICQSYK